MFLSLVMSSKTSYQNFLIKLTENIVCFYSTHGFCVIERELTREKVVIEKYFPVQLKRSKKLIRFNMG
jgi:hypothetical protein